MATQPTNASCTLLNSPGNNFNKYPLPIKATPLRLAALLTNIKQLMANAILVNS